jgi:hypothetical protein
MRLKFPRLIKVPWMVILIVIIMFIFDPDLRTAYDKP